MRRLIALCLLSAVPAFAGEFTPLFDGKSLGDWTATKGGKWEMVDGVVTGTSPKSDPHHGILLSPRAYTNFIVRTQFRVTEGDSGFYFRVEQAKGNVSVHGFQVEIDSSPETGGLYETGGRAWVVQTDKEKVKSFYKPGEWAELKLQAEGERIQVWINGQPTADLKDPQGRKSGHLGFQLHGGMDMKVEFKGAEISELP
jgi:Domain of Unknown Function (DUF1080)